MRMRICHAPRGGDGARGFALFSDDSTLACHAAHGEPTVKIGRARRTVSAAPAPPRWRWPACASGARKPDVTAPQAYEAPAGTQDLSVQQLDRWWLIFGDDELNQLEAQALAGSPDVKTEIARLREAGATENSGIWQTYPTGDITGGASREITKPIGGAPSSLIPVGGVTEDLHADFKPSWEVDFLGALAQDAQGRARPTTRRPGSTSRPPARPWSPTSPTSTSWRAAWRSRSSDAKEQLEIENRAAEHRRRSSSSAASDPGPTRTVSPATSPRPSRASTACRPQQHAAQRTLLILVGRGHRAGREPAAGRRRARRAAAAQGGAGRAAAAPAGRARGRREDARGRHPHRARQGRAVPEPDLRAGAGDRPRGRARRRPDQAASR